MQLEWWHWAVTGIVLILAELAVPAFVLIWFGLGALLVALVVAVATIGVTAQLAVWLVVSVLLVFLWFKVFRPERYRTRIGMSAPAMIGEVGVLTQPVAPFGRGEVRFQKPLLGADVWPCMADEEITAGTRVKVVAVEGSLLKIGRTS
jgi:membrane protein implicated in regulation of membrane protease activity